MLMVKWKDYEMARVVKKGRVKVVVVEVAAVEEEVRER